MEKYGLMKKENGDKSASNVNIKGVKVKLVDVTTGIVSTDKDGVEISAETNDDGIYQLSNIKEGKYIVIFEYDKSKYKPTIYQKEGIEESNNSDAIFKKYKNKWRRFRGSSYRYSRYKK